MKLKDFNVPLKSIRNSINKKRFNLKIFKTIILNPITKKRFCFSKFIFQISTKISRISSSSVDFGCLTTLPHSFFSCS